MKRFRNLLVWIEDSTVGGRALDQAVAVARESGARLTLAHAVEPPQRLFRALYPHADELHAGLLRDWNDRLEAAALPLSREGLDVATRVLEGKPFVAFTQEVIRAGHDLLVKAAEAKEGGAFFGSTDLHLLRKCPSAVWITGREAPRSPRVLALVDPAPENEELNHRILQIATSLGELRSAPVDVLHVWQADSESLLASRVRPEELAAYVQGTRERSEAELAGLLERSGVTVPEDRVHLVKGDVRDVAPELARREEAGLIVMGTLCRTGIHGVLIGNTAETILTRVECPVLTVKPEGFVSPVEA